MSGWEAMQQGAPDPFFAEGRAHAFVPTPLNSAEGCGVCWKPESDPLHRLQRPEPQFLGSGAVDFQQCDDCAWDICGQAKACLRRKCRT